MADAPELPFVVPDDDDGARQRQQAEAERKAERHEKAAKAWRTIPDTYRAHENELLARCSPIVRARLAKSPITCSAFLFGPTGTGKTTALALLVRRALAEFEASDGKRCAEAPGLLWTTASELALSDRRHPLGSDKPPLLAQAITAPLLVLDEVGIEPSGVIFEILQARYGYRRPVLATSGLTKRQLTEHLGAAGVRRLTDQHAGYPPLNVDAHERADSKGPGGGKG